ncbi:hypothetical protein [Streptomyces sp. Inha503]|uniref:hypothetical protein n=1 Tax=Streptomyces sp. Inha503 TaxID=3383314 RepID=UPI00399F1E72
MYSITSIKAEVYTAAESAPTTTSLVFLGFGGREFRLDTASDGDFTGPVNTVFILGGPGANVLNPQRNDPTRPQITTRDLERPVYLRLGPAGAAPEWVLEYAKVTAYGPSNEPLATWNTPALRDNTEPKTRKIWLGDPYGLIYYLTRDAGSPTPTPTPEPPEPQSA